MKVMITRDESSKSYVDLLLEKKLLEASMTDTTGPYVQVNCRISGESVQDLKTCADAFGQSISSLAGELLQAAVADARSLLTVERESEE